MTPRPQTERILAVLADNEWHGFDEIKTAVGAPFSMLERRGELKRMGHEIERRGEWYRLVSERRAASPVPDVKGEDLASVRRSENSLSPRPAASSPVTARRATPLSAVPEIEPWKDHGLWSIRA